MTPELPAGEQRTLIDKQLAYYRARAPEYEDWWADHRADHPSTWADEVRELEQNVARLGPTGSILELACGTGIWTRHLVGLADRITAVDGAPETIALNRARLPDGAPVEFVVADLFEWEPVERYDVVFFSFWLSHVPPDRFDAFWGLVDRALEPGGRFFLIDNREAYVTAAGSEPSEGFRSRRTLRDGREFTIVKEFFEPQDLVERLGPLGWDVRAAATGDSFVYAEGHRIGEAVSQPLG